MLLSGWTPLPGDDELGQTSSWRRLMARYLWLAMGAIGLSLMAYWLIAPAHRSLLSPTISALPIISIAISFILYRSPVRKAWALVSLGVVGFFIGALATHLIQNSWLTPAVQAAENAGLTHWLPIVQIVSFVAGAALTLAGSFWLAWYKRTFTRWIFIDLGIIAIACFYLTWFLLIDPVHGQDFVPNYSLFNLVFFLASTILVVDLVLRLLFDSSRRPPSLWFFVIALTTVTFSQTWFIYHMLRGTYEAGSIGSLGWQVGAIFWSLTVLHPSMLKLSKSTISRTENHLPRWRLGALIAASLIPSVFLITNRNHFDYSDHLVVSLGTIVTILLIVWRLTGLLHALRLNAKKRIELQAELQAQALRDPATGLATRALFAQKIERALRRKSSEVAVLHYNIDDFNQINDRFGSESGDNLLLAFAARLQKQMRNDDLAARLGGDEFGLLLSGVEDRTHTMQTAKRILKAVSEAYQIDGQTLRIGASVGIAFGAEGNSADEILRQADIAMYLAKNAGKGQCEIFNPSMKYEALNRISMRAELEHAVDEEQFQVYYQPIVDLHSGKVAALESLVRWDHPERGLVSPDQFIPTAETTGLIVPLGLWILAEGCRQMQAWIDDGTAGQADLTVNVSPVQMRQPQFLADVRTVLRDSKLDPRRLILEVTEGAIAETKSAVELLEQLRKLGIRIAIDDFGTGYSALGRLSSLPIDHIKIDRSFVEVLGRSERETVLTEAVLRIANKLKLSTVAEGIESLEQVEILKKLGCKLGQGYLFSRPLDRTAATTYLQSRQEPISSDLIEGEQLIFGLV